MTPNKRILYVVNTDRFFETHRLAIAKRAQENFEIHLAAEMTHDQDFWLQQNITPHATDLHQSRSHPFQLLKSCYELYRIYREVQPDIVHLISIKPVIFGGLVGRFCRIPLMIIAVPGLGYIYTAEGWWAKLRRQLIGWLYRTVNGHPHTRWIFQNPSDRNTMMHVAKLKPEQCILTHGSGVDLNHYQPNTPPSAPPLILFAGRLLGNKGIYEFIDAIRLIKHQCQARFVVVGDIDLHNPSSLDRRTLQSWVDESFIEWWGYQNSIIDTLAMSYCVVLPSHREGLPKVLIEAQAMGRPVITTDAPGCRDAIQANETGLLVPVNDSQALARAMLHLIDQPELSQSMGKKARLWAEKRFDIQTVIKQHLELYQL